MKITLFSQILALIDRSIFNKLVTKHGSDQYSKDINSWTHLVSMLFMQLAKAESVRDISNGLRSATGDLSHLGVTKAPSKSSISYINAHYTYALFEELYFALLDELEPNLQRRRQYAQKLKRKVFIMDSTIIPLALSLFDWAKFKTAKGAITDGKTHDIKVAKHTLFPKGSLLVVDRAYVDFEWLFNLDRCDQIYSRIDSKHDV